MFQEDWFQVAGAVEKPDPGRKPKIAVYTAAGCGGCDLSLIDLGMKFLDIAGNIEVVLWPLLTDIKYRRVKRMYDKAIDICLFNGAITNHLQEDMARLLRKKSRILASIGSCAYLGGIPGMSRFGSRGTQPSEKRIKVPEGTLSPELCVEVHPLSDFVEVDYVIPGCPPPTHLIARLMVNMLKDDLPPRGLIYAGNRSLCYECGRGRDGKVVKTFLRSHEKEINPKKCLLDQGLLCAGPVTRAGCGLRCVSVNMPCRGCFGPPEEFIDAGAAYVSTLASIAGGRKEVDIRKTVGSIVALGGTAYRFSLAASILKENRAGVPGK